VKGFFLIEFLPDSAGDELKPFRNITNTGFKERLPLEEMCLYLSLQKVILQFEQVLWRLHHRCFSQLKASWHPSGITIANSIKQALSL